MDENNYQKLGSRTLIYDIATRSSVPLIILLMTLAMVMVKSFSSSAILATNTGSPDMLATLISWGFLATVATFVVVIFISWLGYTMFEFRLDSDIFKIKRGIFNKQEIAIPYRRIESVDIKRNLIQQLFGVSRINIETTIDSQASGDDKKDSSDEVFPVIDSSLAQTIQEELTKRANVQKMQV